MSLFELKLNTEAVVKEIDVENEKLKIRLMELGFLVDTKIKVLSKSMLKKTLLISINSCCFTIKDKIAKSIKVLYA